jgi:hypothetical protein
MAEIFKNIWAYCLEKEIVLEISVCMWNDVLFG